MTTLTSGDGYADSEATDTGSILLLWNGKGCHRQWHLRTNVVGIGDVAPTEGVINQPMKS